MLGARRWHELIKGMIMTDPVRHHSSVTGEFETAAEALSDPGHSVTESLHDAELTRAVRELVAQFRAFQDAVDHVEAILGM